MTISTEQSANGQFGTLIWYLAQGEEVVFGLDWSALVGGEPLALGRRRARALRATHYLVLNELAAVVGCGIVHQVDRRSRRIRQSRGKTLYSAAAMFAQAHSEGVFAAVYSMQDKGYWLIASNAGLVLAQTDRWYANLDEVEAVLSGLKARFPNLQISRAMSLVETSPPDWILNNLILKTRVQSITASGQRALVIVSAILLICGLIWLWTAKSIDSSEQAPVENPEALWRQVYENFVKNHPVHHPDHLFRVMNAWQVAPLSPDGWRLKQIMCESAQMDWHCAARYQRFNMLARSDRLEAARPEGWRAEFIDLDHGILRWQVIDAASLFQPVSMTAPMKSWLSYLQNVSPVFESIQIGTGTTISLSAPVGRHGVILEKPSLIKPLKRRSISIKGPLRSMTALKGFPVPVRWRGMQLDIGSPSGQGIRRSELTVSLTGEIFEVSE